MVTLDPSGFDASGIVPTGLPSFELQRPSELGEALRLMTAGGRVLAGGTDLLGLMKDGIAAPPVLVELSGVAELQTIAEVDGGLRIGAGVKLRALIESAMVGERCPALADAASQVGSSQIRNMGTVGGNLCQKPRCWYYRSRFFLTAKEGGDICFAQEYDTLQHGAARPPCVAAHPSDLAPVLLAAEGTMLVASTRGERTLTAEAFFETNIVADETAMQADELLLAIEIPAAPEGQRMAFLKIEERDSWGFASVSVAAALRMSGETVEEARIGVGSLARLPFRARASEEFLAGRRLSDATLTEAGQRTVQRVFLTADHIHKGEIAVALIRRALQAAARA